MAIHLKMLLLCITVSMVRSSPHKREMIIEEFDDEGMTPIERDLGGKMTFDDLMERKSKREAGIRETLLQPIL